MSGAENQSSPHFRRTAARTTALSPSCRAPSLRMRVRFSQQKHGGVGKIRPQRFERIEQRHVPRTALRLPHDLLGPGPSGTMSPARLQALQRFVAPAPRLGKMQEDQGDEIVGALRPVPG